MFDPGLACRRPLRYVNFFVVLKLIIGIAIVCSNVMVLHVAMFSLDGIITLVDTFHINQQLGRSDESTELYNPNRVLCLMRGPSQ